MRTCDHCGANLDPQEICDCHHAHTEEVSLRCVSPPVISENLTSITAHIEATLSVLSTLPRDKEGCAAAKAMRADLRHRFDGLENQRKAVKAAVMEPYLAAEAVYKEKISTPFADADKQLKAWVDSYQDEIKAACRQDLQDYFNELCDALQIDFVTFEQTGVTVDMATANLKDPKKARNAIHDFLNRIEEDRTAIASMANAEEIMAEYRQSLSLSVAIAAVNDRLERTQQSHRELEQLRHRQESAAPTRQSLYIEAPEIAPEEEAIFTVAIRITETLPRLRALKAFLDANHYTYEEE